MPCDPWGDLTCYLLDDFHRTVTPPGMTAGTKLLGYEVWQGRTREGEDQENGNVITSMPFYIYQHRHRHVASTLGANAWPHTENPGFGCGGLDFTFSGWFEWSTWFKIPISNRPANLAGMNVGGMVYQNNGGLAGGTVGMAEGALVIAKNQEPGHHRDGTVVGHLERGVVTTVFVPANIIPPDGGDLWIGVAPNWECNKEQWFTCGARWPWMDGKGNSGWGWVDPSSFHGEYQTWTLTEGDWGGALSDDVTGAWWYGNIPWTVVGSGGTYGIDGERIYIEATTGPETLEMEMPGEARYDVEDDENDDNAYGAPWGSEHGVKMKIRFRLTTAGSLTDSGERYLRAEWHDGRQLAGITAHLGDSSRAQGLSINTIEGTEYKAKDITEGSWMWLILDSRNPGWLRGKMWAEEAMYGSGEPAIFDVQLAQDDDSTDPTEDDFFRVAMSVGNASGAAQKLEIDAIYFCNGADDCEWVMEQIGEGDGTSTKYSTSMPFKDGSLWFFVDGHHVRWTVSDKEQGTFYTMTGTPAPDNAPMIARYLVDRNPAGD